MHLRVLLLVSVACQAAAFVSPVGVFQSARAINTRHSYRSNNVVLEPPPSTVSLNKEELKILKDPLKKSAKNAVNLSDPLLAFSPHRQQHDEAAETVTLKQNEDLQAKTMLVSEVSNALHSQKQQKQNSEKLGTVALSTTKDQLSGLLDQAVLSYHLLKDEKDKNLAETLVCDISNALHNHDYPKQQVSPVAGAIPDKTPVATRTLANVLNDMDEVVLRLAEEMNAKDSEQKLDVSKLEQLAYEYCRLDKQQQGEGDNEKVLVVPPQVVTAAATWDVHSLERRVKKVQSRVDDLSSTHVPPSRSTNVTAGAIGELPSSSLILDVISAAPVVASNTLKFVQKRIEKFQPADATQPHISPTPPAPPPEDLSRDSPPIASKQEVQTAEAAPAADNTTPPSWFLDAITTTASKRSGPEGTSGLHIKANTDAGLLGNSNDSNENTSGAAEENSQLKEEDNEIDDEVDIAIVGAGIGGLCAGAILNTLYGKTVGIYESHYLPGGCAHAFDRTAKDGTTFTFDSGPTIVLGCSAPPFNPLEQVLQAIGQPVEWIRYDGWGMIENPTRDNELRWKLTLGPNHFEEGPLAQFGGESALQEFCELREKTKGLVDGATQIPALAMRSGGSALIPLLRYFPALVEIIKQGELTTGTFAPFMDGPLFVVKDQWLRSWLDALAFSLSGLPASRTSAAAMAYVLFDMHRPGAALDYPRGGLGKVIDALVAGVEQGDLGSKINLRRHVESIDTDEDGERFTGLTLRGGKKVKAKEGVICNAPVWTLRKLIKNPRAQQVLNNHLSGSVKHEKRQTWQLSEGRSYISTKRPPPTEEEGSFFSKTDTAERTGSFLHLHLAIKSDGLDLNSMEAHYTVMDRSLLGDGTNVEGIPDGPCGELNMIAVSNPCVIDKTLAPKGYMIVHAYGAGNEPYQIWEGVKRNSPEYEKLKQERAQVLWRAVESIIPDVRERVVMDLVGSPKTHERFLRRPDGTYGAATEDYFKDCSTPYSTLLLAGDSIFPGIGVPSVALSGASAANSFVSPWCQWQCLDKLKREGKLQN